MQFLKWYALGKGSLPVNRNEKMFKTMACAAPQDIHKSNHQTRVQLQLNYRIAKILGRQESDMQRTRGPTLSRETKDATKPLMPLQGLSRSCCVFKLTRELIIIKNTARTTDN